MSFNFAEYRKYLFRARAIDGIEMMHLCATDPSRAGAIICSALAKLYGAENIRKSVLEFKVPSGVYKLEEDALWAYLHSRNVRREVLEDVERRHVQNNRNVRDSGAGERQESDLCVSGMERECSEG